jgi:hypothetical protein
MGDRQTRSFFALARESFLPASAKVPFTPTRYFGSHEEIFRRTRHIGCNRHSSQSSNSTPMRSRRPSDVVPKGVRSIADRDARAAYAHTPGQPPNEILGPGGAR